MPRYFSKKQGVILDQFCKDNQTCSIYFMSFIYLLCCNKTINNMLSNKHKHFNMYGYTKYAFTKNSKVSSYHLWQNLGLIQGSLNIPLLNLMLRNFSKKQGVPLP